MIGYLCLVAAVGLERIAELVVSKRNLSVSLARGGREYGAGHYPAMVVLHTGLLVSCAAEALIAGRGIHPQLALPMGALVLASQALRWWCISTLGWRWNTKIVLVAELPLIRRGPYRWLSHPNYVAVVVEIVALPLVAGAWVTATVFSLANVALLRVRIRAENAALATAVSA